MATGTLHLLAQHITASAVHFQREQTALCSAQGLERGRREDPSSVKAPQPHPTPAVTAPCRSGLYQGISAVCVCVFHREVRRAGGRLFAALKRDPCFSGSHLPALRGLSSLFGTQSCRAVLAAVAAHPCESVTL